jgi:hypothetical protein
MRELARDAARDELVAALDGELALQNAVVFGVSSDGLQTFFSSVCDNVSQKLEDRIGETLLNVPPKSFKLSVDDACDPWVNVSHFSVAPVAGTDVTCTVTPETGQVNIFVDLPDWQVVARASGYCCDCWWIFCWSSVSVNAFVDVFVEDLAFNFDITEQIALAGGEAPGEFFEGTIRGEDRGSGVSIGCFVGFLLDILNVLTFGLVDIEGGLTDKVQDIFTFENDIGEGLRKKSRDPLEVKKFKVNEGEITQRANLRFSQDLVDVQITPQGLTAALSVSFSVPEPDPELDIIPEATLTPAPAPTFPVQGAEDVFSVFSDDTFGLLFAGLTAQGALKTECVESGLTVSDLLPEDCDALGTAQERGKCKGAKGVDCSTLPLLSGERLPCNTTQNKFELRSIYPDTPLLFCARRGLSPRLLIQDSGATPDVVEARLHVNDLRVNVLLDRDGGGLDGSFLTTPRCFGPLGLGPGDCKWTAACVDLDLATDLTLSMGDGEDPQIVPTVGGVLGDPVGVQCEGEESFGDEENLLSEAGSSDPISAIEANIDALTPIFQTEGLNLGGLVRFRENPKLIAIETQTDPDCTTCQEYIGATGDISTASFDESAEARRISMDLMDPDPPRCAPSERSYDGWCGNTYNPADCCSGMCGVYSSEWWDYFCIDDPVADLGPGPCDFGGGWYVYDGFSFGGYICCNGQKVAGSQCP